jgi:nucleotide-binding universal stress UspA family protein
MPLAEAIGRREGPVFTTVVVGTDGSETASEAVALAVRLAREGGRKLHVVIGVPAAAAVSGPSVGAGASGTQLKTAAQHMLEKVPGGIEGIDVEIHTEIGDPADVLVRWADEVGADLIVVGSKGMRGTRRILGSVPNSVAHKAGCHVLIAKTA